MATKVSLPSDSGSAANEEKEWKNIDIDSKNEMIEWTVEDTPMAEIKWNDNSMIDDDPLLSNLLSPDDEMAVEVVDEGRRPTIEIEDPSTVSPSSSNSDNSMLIVAHRIGSGVGRVGSGSRTQWDSLEEGSITMPLGGLVGGGGERAATKELDLALSIHDNMSINLSEASYTSQATEVACNVSRSSSYSSSRNIPAKQVTPPSSKENMGRTSSSKKKKSDRISEENNDIMLPQDDDTLPTEPPQPRPLGRMFMCGAVHVDNDDLKDSLQDVNATIQQIYTTNRALIKNMNRSFRKKVGLNIDTVEEESFGDREQQQSTGSFVEDTSVVNKTKKKSRPSSDIQRRLV